MIRSAMIMAAGLGTRLRPYSDRIPKPFIPVLGVPAIQFVVDSLADAGVGHCVLNSHHLHQQTVRRVHALDWHGMRVQVSDESGELLGSGGGIAKAAPLFSGAPFFLANADVLFDLSWRKLSERHALLRRKYGAWMTLTLIPRATLGGAYREIQVDASGERVTGLGAAAEGRAFYAGAAIIEPEAVAHLEAGRPHEFVRDILMPAIAQGKVGAEHQEGIWLDVGSPELWAQTHFYLMRELEHGGLRGPSSRAWARRIEDINRRHAPGIWSARKTDLRVHAEWHAPIYCSGQLPAGFTRGPLGPELIAYSPPGDVAQRSHAVVFEDLSTQLKAKSEPDAQGNG